MSQEHPYELPGGIEHADILDGMVYEKSTGRVILVMVERRPWDGGELQLWQLQEKLNAYVSFAVDGEMLDLHPELEGVPVCIQLRSVHEPEDAALDLLKRAAQQLELMEIGLEVWHIGDDPHHAGGCCGGGCSCS